MLFEPEFTKINLLGQKGSICEQIKVEAKTETLSEEVAKVLSVNAFSTINDSDAQNGIINYSGRTVFYISYINKDGALKKCECGSEFKGSIKDPLADDARASVVAKVVKTQTDCEGIKLVASAYVNVCVSINKTLNAEVLTGGENLIVNSDEISYQKGYGIKTLSYPVEEEFELNYPVEEVLSHRAEALITMVQSGVNCIFVDGEVILSIIMLQKTDRSDIIKEVKTFPFRVEIECEDAMPNMQAIAFVKEKFFKTDVAVDEENSKSVVTATVNLTFEGEAFSEDTFSLAQDVFSTEQEVELVKKSEPYFKACQQRSVSVNVVGRSPINELPVGVMVLCSGGEKAEITNKRCEGENIVVTGVVSSVVYLRDGDGKVFAETVEIPFESTLDVCYTCNTLIDIKANVKNSKVKIISLVETELECEIQFTLYPEEKSELCFVSEIKPLGEKKKNTCAISVYIPLEGEELWSLAKRLNVCPESLKQTNPELQFPLTGKERIVVYRQR